MIIIRLEGGLGNSMFQYALGRHLSYKTGGELFFDISSYQFNPLADCSFWLEGFDINIKKRLAKENDIKHFKKYEVRAGRRWFWYNLVIANNKIFVKEKGFDFNSTVLETESYNMYVSGWWQTEKYFFDIRPQLLKDFTVRKPLNGKNRIAAKQILNTNSVGIHIRRADYVTNKKTRHYFGELSQRYYDEAIAYIAQKKPNPKFFIFSDDIASVKEKFSFPIGTIYVDWNSGDNVGHEDMRLMSLCKHNIIANSTFSWWGAWLNQNKNKIVVAPQTWFANYPKMNTKDIIPATWIKIPSYFQN